MFALAGKVERTGLVEVPMGMSAASMIFDIGGGIPRGKEFKAVQMGGPSGGCIPAVAPGHEIDYESLKTVGAIMGSGGMVVMDEDTCMVDVARYFLTSPRRRAAASAPVPHRHAAHAGDPRAHHAGGAGREGNDLEDVQGLMPSRWQVIKDASLCGLGQTAPNPVLTTLKYFRHEYEAHIHDKKCPSLASGGTDHVPHHGVRRLHRLHRLRQEACPTDCITGSKGVIATSCSKDCIKAVPAAK